MRRRVGFRILIGRPRPFGTVSVAPKHFVFLNVWIKHEDFQRVVRDSWVVPVEGAHMHVLATKLKRLGRVLGVWSKELFGDIFAKLREYEERVQVLEGVLQQNPSDERALIEYKEGVAMLQKKVMVEEEFWQQKARVTVVQESDNTSCGSGGGLL
nr:uncharacterized protein LOC109193312 [Ipomoea batatas]